MIKNINPGPFLETAHYNQPWIGGPNTSSDSAGFGMLRYNNINQSIEVYDTRAWIPLSGSVDIKLTNDACELLAWVREQKTRQENLNRMAKENVALSNAIKDLQDATDRVNTIYTLSNKYDR